MHMHALGLDARFFPVYRKLARKLDADFVKLVRWKDLRALQRKERATAGKP